MRSGVARSPYRDAVGMHETTDPHTWGRGPDTGVSTYGAAARVTRVCLEVSREHARALAMPVRLRNSPISESTLPPPNRALQLTHDCRSVPGLYASGSLQHTVVIPAVQYVQHYAWTAPSAAAPAIPVGSTPSLPLAGAPAANVAHATVAVSLPKSIAPTAAASKRKQTTF